ncbi:MAG: IS3 family transposase [Clostridia bacterium]|nr:IS3 family transposase [Clostridia bacterium]
MSLSRVRHGSKYRALEYFHETQQWSIPWMCRKLGISRASYYKWKRRKIPREESENRQLAELILEYEESYGYIFGYRRMTMLINRLNRTDYRIKRIHRIMKAIHVRARIRRKRRQYVSSTPETTAENLLKRDFLASRPNEKWVTDVTEFRVPKSKKKLYLRVIFDLYDRMPVAYVVRGTNNNPLVFDTYDMAIQNNPGARPILHSDRGFQYTSKMFQMKLETQGIQQSMSRKGHCIDNGPMEGFWGIVKAEMFQMYDIHDESSLRDAIDRYIDFYMNERPQERFRARTPMEVRTAALAAEEPEQYPIAVNKKIQKYKERYGRTA